MIQKTRLFDAGPYLLFRSANMIHGFRPPNRLLGKWLEHFAWVSTFHIFAGSKEICPRCSGSRTNFHRFVHFCTIGNAFTLSARHRDDFWVRQNPAPAPYRENEVFGKNSVCTENRCVFFSACGAFRIEDLTIFAVFWGFCKGGTLWLSESSISRNN